MHFNDFFGETEHFSGKNGALRWSILVGKQKHNVQKPTDDFLSFKTNICNFQFNPDWQTKSYFVHELPLNLYYFIIDLLLPKDRLFLRDHQPSRYICVE